MCDQLCARLSTCVTSCLLRTCLSSFVPGCLPTWQVVYYVPVWPALCSAVYLRDKLSTTYLIVQLCARLSTCVTNCLLCTCVTSFVPGCLPVWQVAYYVPVWPALCPAVYLRDKLSTTYLFEQLCARLSTCVTSCLLRTCVTNTNTKLLFSLGTKLGDNSDMV
jgi:hypothetical protein